MKNASGSLFFLFHFTSHDSRLQMEMRLCVFVFLRLHLFCVFICILMHWNVKKTTTNIWRLSFVKEALFYTIFSPCWLFCQCESQMIGLSCSDHSKSPSFVLGWSIKVSESGWLSAFSSTAGADWKQQPLSQQHHSVCLQVSWRLLRKRGGWGGREGGREGVWETVRQIELEIGMHMIWMRDEAGVEESCRKEDDFLVKTSLAMRQWCKTSLGSLI